jgi:hypothetical protein
MIELSQPVDSVSVINEEVYYIVKEKKDDVEYYSEYHLKLFKEEPGYVPEYLLIKNSLYCVLDLDKKELRYYENFHNRTEVLA